MRFFIFSLMLVAAVHAITCTEGLLMYYKEFYGMYISGTDAFIDSTSWVYSDNGDFRSEKFIRESDVVKTIVKSSENGEIQVDTNIILHLVKDFSTHSDSNIAYRKTLGDTVFIEGLIYEPGGSTSRYTTKTFTNGIVLDYIETYQKKGETFSNKNYIEVILKNDTLFRLILGSGNGAPMDTSKFEFYVTSPNDDHACGGYTITETTNGFVIEEIRHNGTNQYFMRYTDGHTTSIAKRPSPRMKEPSRDYYFDTKGRKNHKVIPYRVQF